jgi:peptide/nickel transport system permease protein
MQSYIIRRILLLIPTVFIVALIVFFLVRFVPGSAVDVIEAQLSQGGSINIDRAAIAHALGLDVPAYIQLWRWLGAIVLHGDFGNSIIQNRPVIQMVAERLPITLELSLLTLCIEVIIALPLGIYSAVRQDTPSDYVGRTISVLMMAIPNFWLATLVMIYPSTWWGWSPSVELISFSKDPLGNLGMFILPAAILGAAGAGGLMRMTRTMMLEVMRQDYVRTAWAKGLNEGTVIVRHAVKNAFIPVITIIGSGVGNILGGAVIMENIFCLPGMGQLVLTALNNRDYPLVSAITLIISVFVMVVNLVVDIAYTWLDPRIRYQ